MSNDEKLRLIEEWKQLKQRQTDYEQAPFLYFEPWGQQTGFHESRAQIRIMIGGNRCLAGEQLIYDPVLDVERRVDEIVGPHHVLAWDGESLVVAEALEPFRKGPPSWIYEVVLDSGESFRASGEHLVMGTSSWTPVNELRPGSSLFLPESTSVVASIRRLRRDFKWDFTVPGLHNYWAGGALHHNTGKSTSGIIEDISFTLGFRPDGSKDGLPHGPTKGLIVVNDRAKIETTIMPKILEFCPRSWITRIKNGTDGLPSVLTFKNGSKIWLASYAQDVKSQEGADWDWVHFDEPPPRAIWIAIRRGLLDRKGRAWFTMTPLNCAWIHKELYLRADGIRISVHSLSLRDNPYISRAEKESFIADLHPDEIAARVDGKFSHLEGAIFKEFRRDIHVVHAHKPPDGAPIFMVMDPHDRRPSYLIWCYVDRRDRLVVFDEWPNEDFSTMKTSQLSIRDMAMIIKDKEGSKIRPVERIIDPNFGRTPSHMTGRTLIEEYQEYDLDFYAEINNDISLGHTRIHERLEYKKRDPSLLVCDNCSNMLWAFESYVWRTRDIEGEYTARERPGEAGKDQIDTIRYLLDYDPNSSMSASFDAPQPFSEDDYGDGYG